MTKCTYCNEEAYLPHFISPPMCKKHYELALLGIRMREILPEPNSVEANDQTVTLHFQGNAKAVELWIAALSAGSAYQINQETFKEVTFPFP